MPYCIQEKTASCMVTWKTVSSMTHPDFDRTKDFFDRKKDPTPTAQHDVDEEFMFHLHQRNLPNIVAAQKSEIRIREPAVSPMASSAVTDPENPDGPEVEQPEHPTGPEANQHRTNTPEPKAVQAINQDAAQSQQTDKPWSPKDTFKWMINILRCHNALASSHVRLQAEVNQLRQDMIEAAKHPIPPIWSQEGAEAFQQVPKNSAFAQHIIAELPATPDWGTPSTPEPEETPSDQEDPPAAPRLTTPPDITTEATPDKSPMPTQAQREADAQLRTQLAQHIPPNTVTPSKQASKSPATTASHTAKPSTSATLSKARPAFPPAPPTPRSKSSPAATPAKPRASSATRAKRQQTQPPIKAKPPHRPPGPTDTDRITAATKAKQDNSKKHHTKATHKAANKATPPPPHTQSKTAASSASKTQATLTAYQRTRQKTAPQESETTPPQTRAKRPAHRHTAYSPEEYGTAYPPNLEEELDAEIEGSTPRHRKKKRHQE